LSSSEYKAKADFDVLAYRCTNGHVFAVGPLPFPSLTGDVSESQ